MTLMIVQFVGSAWLIVVAGIMLTKSADQIAQVTGLGGLLIGSVFLAAATSLPELMVDLSAVRQGMPNLAVGDLLGSSLFNLLILAVCDLLHHDRGRMFSRAAAMHALSATQSMAMTALAGIGILLAPVIAAQGFAGFSYATWAIIIAYGLGLRLVFYDQMSSARPLATHRRSKILRQLVGPIIRYIACALLIFLVAPYLAEAAGQIADATNLGKTFVGTTLVAFCTSLPELVTSIAAVRMRAFDLAIGNIFGSNAFNMLLLAPLDFVSKAGLFAHVAQTHAITCLMTILITSVAVMGQLYQVERRRRFIEPDAILIILLVFAGITILYFLK